jgi:glycosyltransferase involved in cell wall biosynthesis
MPPLVSICIPAYNAEATLASCLRSVLIQDVPDMEIVLVDNCSTDRTIELAREMLSEHPRARIIRNATNVGRIGNWNRCLEEARGKYIKFAFTNDAFYRGAVKLLLDQMLNHVDRAWVGSDSAVVTELPKEVPAVASNAITVQYSSGESLSFLAEQGFRTGSLNGMLFDATRIQERGLTFDEKHPYFADFLFTIALSRQGGAAICRTPTYSFNEGVSGRYHHVGMQNARAFFIEHRHCTDELACALHAAGLDSDAAYRYLRGRYLYYLGTGVVLSGTDAAIIFRGLVRDQIQVVFKTLWYHFAKWRRGTHSS